MASLSDRFTQMPRSMRWLSFALALIIAFLVWDTTQQRARAWRGKADLMESNVRAVVDTASLQKRVKGVKHTIQGLGPVSVPGPAAAGRATLNEAVVAVLAEYNISDDSFELRGGGGKLPRDATRGIFPSGERVSRLNGELKFIATPDDAMAIISDFERRDDIESVSAVRFTKDSGRKIRVQLTLETWVQAEG